MGKNKKTYNPDPLNASWLKWLVIVFIIYSVVSSLNKDRNLAEQDFTQSEAGKRIGSTITVAGHNAQYTNKAYLKNMRIGGEIAGNGDSVQCGEIATVSVVGSLSDGRPFFENEKPMQVSVGSHNKQYPWIAGITGMSVGGIRELIIPAYSFIDDKKLDELGLTKKDNIHFKVNLDKAVPTVPPQKLPFRALEIESGDGTRALCGSTVKLHLDIWGADGNKIFTSRVGKHKGAISLTIGNSAIFYGLDRGVLGMMEGGQRSITIPIAYLQSSQQLKRVLDKKSIEPIMLNSISSESDPYEYIHKLLPKDQIVIVDISLISVE